MRRREFLISGVGATWAFAAYGQQVALPLVGLVRSGSLEEAAEFVSAFREGLSEAGFVERRNVLVDVRSGSGSGERVREVIEELIRQQVAVLVTNNLATRVAKALTTSVPIVFATGTDPLKSGFVANLNRPEANVTGVSFIGTALLAKRIELLHELTPGTPVIGVLLDASSPQFENQLRETDDVVRTIGRRITIATVSNPKNLVGAFESLLRDGAGAVVVGTGSIFTDERHQLVEVASRHKVPTTYSVREFVDAGGLLSYGASQKEAYRQAGVYVGRILKGAEPGDLPVLQPTRFELAINLKTANALGLIIPPTLLARADEVIE